MRAIVEIRGCLVTKYGYPGDADLDGHRLRKKGLGRRGIFEVLHSNWIRQLSRQHKLTKSDRPGPENLRHFVFTFHDSTLECIAEDLIFMPSHERMGEILARLSQIIRTTDEHR